MKGGPLNVTHLCRTSTSQYPSAQNTKVRYFLFLSFEKENPVLFAPEECKHPLQTTSVPSLFLISTIIIPPANIYRSCNHSWRIQSVKLQSRRNSSRRDPRGQIHLRSLKQSSCNGSLTLLETCLHSVNGWKVQVWARLDLMGEPHLERKKNKNINSAVNS